ncbi:MAG: hypothetical protein CM1200mP40_10360 [Gammaproteobacteria bacterium]|nr:MAG: hypothetical protein CM1200mP40_10360 [Gammaproteobacteria bacterium]
MIGGGEPEIPGISIGHNEHGAWGLTVFNTDGEDLYVYKQILTIPISIFTTDNGKRCGSLPRHLMLKVVIQFC